MNNRKFRIIGFSVLFLSLALLGLITYAHFNSNKTGELMDHMQNTTPDDSAPSTTKSASSTEEKVDNSDDSQPNTENEDVYVNPVTEDWDQYMNTQTYEYEHPGLGYVFSIPTMWGYMDLDEEGNPTNAWFYPSDEHELSTEDRETLKDETDARIRIVTHFKFPFGEGDNRQETMKVYGGTYQEVPFSISSDAIEVMYMGKLPISDEDLEGVSYNALLPKGKGFVSVDTVYKTEAGKKDVEAFIYHFAQTFQI